MMFDVTIYTVPIPPEYDAKSGERDESLDKQFGWFVEADDSIQAITKVMTKFLVLPYGQRIAGVEVYLLDDDRLPGDDSPFPFKDGMVIKPGGTIELHITEKDISGDDDD